MGLLNFLGSGFVYRSPKAREGYARFLEMLPSKKLRELAGSRAHCTKKKLVEMILKQQLISMLQSSLILYLFCSSLLFTKFSTMLAITFWDHCNLRVLLGHSLASIKSTSDSLRLLLVCSAEVARIQSVKRLPWLLLKKSCFIGNILRNDQNDFVNPTSAGLIKEHQRDQIVRY